MISRVACLYFAKPIDTEKLAENCLRFSPQVAVAGRNAVFIEIGKCARLYSEQSFLARLQVIFRRLEISGEVALGSDITDSLIRAKFKTADPLSLPLSSLLDFADPLNRDEAIRKHVLKMIANFEDLGISTIGNFKNIPMKELSTRFGPVGILCHQRARNQMGIQWPFWKPRETIEEREDYMHWDYGGTLEPILFSVKKMLDQIFYRLYGRGQHLQGLLIRVSSEVTSRQPVKTREFQFQYMFPQSATRGALTIIHERLSKEFQKSPIKTAVESLEVIVTSTAQATTAQKSLLHDQEEKQEQLHTLINHLRESYGQESVYQAVLTEDRRPEKSWKKALKKGEAIAQVSIEGAVPMRPTHLIKPEKIEVSGDVLYIRRQAKKITRWQKSFEKLSGAWVEIIDGKLSGGFERTYFTVEIAGGNKLSIFESENEFFLHGYFG